MFFVDPDISVAKTLSTDFYLDDPVFERSKQKIFRGCWHFAGDEDLVASKNDCYPFSLLPGYLDEPLVLTRDSKGNIHCVSNVCTHRGNMVVQTPCNQPHLRCNYHGRLFDHDGGFRSMPEFRGVKDFPSAGDDLARMKIFQWGKLLFVSPGPFYPAPVFFGDMMQRMRWLPIHEFRFRSEFSQVFTVNANWALYCENYLEGFHIPFVHAGLNTVLDFGSYTTELFPYGSLQTGFAKADEDTFDLPAGSPDHGKKVAAFYFFVFPNMMFNFYPWGLSVNIVEPLAKDKTQVRFLKYVWKEALMNKGAGAALDKVELEDEQVVEAVQKGIRSGFYTHGRYSVNREQGTHHFHRLLCEFMNKDAG